MAKQQDFKLLAKINDIPIEETKIIQLSPGNRLGPKNRYEIINCIGVGSIGAVYLAKDHQDNQNLLALKILLPNILNSEKKIDLFVDNLTALQYLKHKNVVQIYDFWKQGTLYFYTMEYIDGDTIQDWIIDHQTEHKYIPVPLICKLMLQVCEGLDQLHKTSGHYLIHPKNLLILKNEEEYKIKICNFGLYHLQNGNFWLKASLLSGTEKYKAPEQFQKPNSLNRQSDIFSIGVLLHQMVYLDTPDCKQKFLFRRNDIPENLIKLIHQLTITNPQKRLNGVDSTIEKLEEILLSYEKIELTRAKTQFRDEATKIRVTGRELPKISNSKEQEQNQEEYEKLVNQAQVLLGQKRYTEAIALLKKAYILNDTSLVYNLLDQAQSSMEKAIGLKLEALVTSDDIGKAIELLKESITIYPYDIEAKNHMAALIKTQKKSKDNEEEAQKILLNGDKLVEEGKFEEAVKLWNSMIEKTDHDNEFKERIMQVVDMMGEVAQTHLESDEIYKANEIISWLIKYSDDDFIQYLHLNIKNALKDNEAQFSKVLQEGEKHFQKKQFAAAAEAWSSGLGFNDYSDRFLKNKIQEAMKFEKKAREDESEYIHLLNTALVLEKREDYQGTLQALQKIAEKEQHWLCPVKDISKEIERIRKLKAASKFAQQAKNSLIEANSYINKGHLKKAKEVLNRPIFNHILIPTIQNRFDKISSKLNIRLRKQKQLWLGIKIVCGVLGAITIGILYLVLST